MSCPDEALEQIVSGEIKFCSTFLMTFYSFVVTKNGNNASLHFFIQVP